MRLAPLYGREMRAYPNSQKQGAVGRGENEAGEIILTIPLNRKIDPKDHPVIREKPYQYKIFRPFGPSE